ncbi:MAG: hypothetical protein EPO64_09630 [Nitrospirae bacterium]|nr:MAG: hypothetical protein EPO64_09630 [Nitrospirota bacterium]
MRNVVVVLVTLGLAACAGWGGMARSPRALLASNDHAALAAWYEQDAAHLREHAAEMKALAEEYKKAPGTGPGPGFHEGLPPKVDLVEHCEILAEMYTKAAEKADAMARAHRNAKR